METDFRPKNHVFVVREDVDFPAGKGHTSSEAVRRFEQRCRREYKTGDIAHEDVTGRPFHPVMDEIR